MKTLWGIPLRLDKTVEPDTVRIEKVSVSIPPETRKSIQEQLWAEREKHPELFAYLDEKIRRYLDELMRECSWRPRL